MLTLAEFRSYFEQTPEKSQKIKDLITDLMNDYALSSSQKFQETVDKYYTRVEQQKFKEKIINLYLGKLDPLYNYYSNTALYDLEISDLINITRILVKLMDDVLQSI